MYISEEIYNKICTYILRERWVGLLLVPCEDVDVDDCGVCGYDYGKALPHDVPRDYVHGCCGHHYDDYWNDAYLVLELLRIFHFFKVNFLEHFQDNIVH